MKNSVIILLIGAFSLLAGGWVDALSDRALFVAVLIVTGVALSFEIEKLKEQISGLVVQVNNLMGDLSQAEQELSDLRLEVLALQSTSSELSDRGRGR